MHNLESRWEKSASPGSSEKATPRWGASQNVGCRILIMWHNNRCLVGKSFRGELLRKLSSTNLNRFLSYGISQGVQQISKRHKRQLFRSSPDHWPPLHQVLQNCEFSSDILKNRVGERAALCMSLGRRNFHGTPSPKKNLFGFRGWAYFFPFARPLTTASYFAVELFIICKTEISICKEDIPANDLSS